MACGRRSGHCVSSVLAGTVERDGAAADAAAAAAAGTDLLSPRREIPLIRCHGADADVVVDAAAAAAVALRSGGGGGDDDDDDG